MQGLILAAGMGKRLKELTADRTKCMVEVNGVTLIERMLHQLDRLKLSRIVMVIGYRGQELKAFIGKLPVKTEIVWVENPDYARTNNIYSLYLAREALCREDTLLLESDLIFEDGILEDIVADQRDTLALVDKYESWMDGTCVKVSEDDRIEAFVPGKNFRFEEIPSYYKTVNIYKFSRAFSETHYVPFLEAYSKALGNNAYYEQVLRVITMLEDPGIRAKRLTGQHWYEIDDVQDLNIAASIFTATPEERVRAMEKRYGGFWRYPKLLDFCYLVNPYFPPQRMLDEIRVNFDALVRRYPSGLAENRLLAAKNFGLSSEEILVGNGAAELIKALMEDIPGKVGVVRPTFEEYPNRLSEEAVCVFRPEKEDFSYTAKELMEFFEDKKIGTLILINPDNPSGNFLSNEEVRLLLHWTKERRIRLIYDESFLDFSETGETLISRRTLQDYPELFVVKSISKSYGVPGLRLGVLASSDTETLERLAKTLPIWNINSVAEFYLQIAEKYQEDYVQALTLFRRERARFYRELKKIPGLTVFPSEASYFLAKLQELSAKTLVERLLTRHDMLLKDLSEKTGGAYIRIAIRDTKDNDRFLQALQEELMG